MHCTIDKKHLVFFVLYIIFAECKTFLLSVNTWLMIDKIKSSGIFVLYFFRWM